MSTCDFDDFHATNHKLNRFWELKDLNPMFRCTVFAIPALGDDEFWSAIPRWIELAVHGWKHETNYECAAWARADIEAVLDSDVVRRHFVSGFKAPGWQISDDCYQVLLERGGWVADQHLEDTRRPTGLRAYLYEDGDNWHGHIQDWGSNGIDETWPQLCEWVKAQETFRFASEAACLSADTVDSGARPDVAGVRAVGVGADVLAVGAPYPRGRD